jgi:hypothetical protein
MNNRKVKTNLTPLSLIALQEVQGLPSGLCWRCSREQGFYTSPCEHCDAINPNFDFDGAVEQQLQLERVQREMTT